MAIVRMSHATGLNKFGLQIKQRLHRPIKSHWHFQGSKFCPKHRVAQKSVFPFD